MALEAPSAPGSFNRWGYFESNCLAQPRTQSKVKRCDFGDTFGS